MEEFNDVGLAEAVKEPGLNIGGVCGTLSGNALCVEAIRNARLETNGDGFRAAAGHSTRRSR